MLGRQRQIRAQVGKLVDGGLFAIALWLAHYLRLHVELPGFPASSEIEDFAEFLPYFLLILATAPVLLELQGFYNRPLQSSRRAIVWQLLKASALAVVGLILVMFLLKGQLARSVFILFGLVSFLVVLSKEEAVRAWRLSRLGRAQTATRVILAGTEADVARLRGELSRRNPSGIEVVAQVDLNTASLTELVDVLHEHSANGVVISAKGTVFGQIERAIQACELEGVEVWLLADFFNTQISQTTVDELYGRPMLVFRCTPDASWQSVAKQVMDLLGAAFLLCVLGLPMLVVGLLIRATSSGPVLFRQQRSGLNGRPFTMLKFRSMVTDAEQRRHELESMNEMSGPVFKVSNDPRITPLGRWLRKYSVDELPQLWNVLTGDMSLVGPRPLPVDEVRRFDDLAHRRRLSVKPGLTCLWQISGRNEVKDFGDWVRLDLEYIDNWSLWLDLKILLRTIPVVFLGTGAK